MTIWHAFYMLSLISEISKRACCSRHQAEQLLALAGVCQFVAVSNLIFAMDGEHAQ